MTNFEHFIKYLDCETLSRMLVKIVVINNNELFYVTTSGQLFPYNAEGYQNALNYELNYWSSQSNYKDKDDENKV